MIKYFASSPRLSLGIDINSTRITLLELSCKKSEYAIQAYASGVLADSKSGFMADEATISGHIHRLYYGGPFKSKNAVLAISDALVYKRIIQIRDDLTESEILEWVRVSVSQLLNDSLENIAIDYQVLSCTGEHNHMLDLLCFAASNEVIKQRLACIVSTGLSVNTIDIESLAVERFLNFILKNESTDQCIALIVIGLDSIFFEIIFNKQLVASYEKSISSGAVSKRIIEFFRSYNADRVNQILLVNPGESSLAIILESELKIITKIFEPFESFHIDNSVVKEQLYANFNTTKIAFGLALREYCG